MVSLYATTKARILIQTNVATKKNVPVVIFANKQDTPGAASESEIRSSVIPDTSKSLAPQTGDIQVFCGSALSGEGIFEALDWLAARMSKV